MIEEKPFRYRRGENWDPASVGPIQTPARGKAARLAEFARLRAEGVPIAEASRRVGVNQATGYRYEHERLVRGMA